MMLIRNFFVATAVCAALLAAGAAEAAKKGGKSTQMPVATAPVSGGSGGTAVTASQGPRPDPETALLNHFDEMDANHDGALTKAEIHAFFDNLRAQAIAKIKAADTDGDGLISQAEADAALPMIAALFPFLDTDQSGKLSAAELQALGTEEGRRAIREAVVARLRAADTNHDGKLDLNELTIAFPRLAARFAQLDKNGDGFLTPEELRGCI